MDFTILHVFKRAVESFGRGRHYRTRQKRVNAKPQSSIQFEVRSPRHEGRDYASKNHRVAYSAQIQVGRRKREITRTTPAGVSEVGGVFVRKSPRRSSTSLRWSGMPRSRLGLRLAGTPSWRKSEIKGVETVVAVLRSQFGGKWRRIPSRPSVAESQCSWDSICAGSRGSENGCRKTRIKPHEKSWRLARNGAFSNASSAISSRRRVVR